MSKISLTNLVNLQNETTAVNAINANNTAVTTAFANTLSRDGTSPNEMNAALDMNSKHILNLPAPATDLDPIRLIDLNNAILGPNANLSGNLTFPGTGGQTRSFVTSMMDYPSSKNWSSGSTAYNEVFSLGGGTIFVPGGGGIVPTLPASYPDVVWNYLGPNIQMAIASENPQSNVLAGSVLRAQHQGSHAGILKIASGVEMTAVGGHPNGPLNADYALMIGAKKKGFETNTGLSGEIDGLTVYIRQNGPDSSSDPTLQSDTNAVHINLLTVGKTGNAAAFEADTSAYATDGITQLYALHTFVGALQNVTPGGAIYGFIAQLNKGTASVGNYIGNTVTDTAGGTWDWAYLSQASSGAKRIGIDGAGKIQFFATDSPDNNKFSLYSSTTGPGTLKLDNNLGTNILSINANGLLTTQGGLAIAAGGSILDFSNGSTIFRAAADGALTLTSQTSIVKTPTISVLPTTAVPAGGTTGSGLTFSSTANLGVFFGSGLPTLSAAQGSVYVRTDGSSTSTRLYINTNGSTTWTNVTTAA